MSGITTHVLDTSRGRPAAGIDVALERLADGLWESLGRGRTDADGRVRALLADGRPLVPGPHRLIFDTAPYFAALGTRSFYPQITIAFEVADPGEHYHVPLLLSPYGYSTYRGS
jgi:5-hydroxyisourate hydrolase